MRYLHIRISDKTHDRLMQEILRNPKVKNKSEFARLILDASLGVGEGELRLSSLEPLYRLLTSFSKQLEAVVEARHFTELALMELLRDMPGLAEEVSQRAREKAAVAQQTAAPRTGPVRKAAPRTKAAEGAPAESPDLSPKPNGPTPPDRGRARDARKRELVRQLTQED
jgi:hypothetical protein